MADKSLDELNLSDQPLPDPAIRGSSPTSTDPRSQEWYRFSHDIVHNDPDTIPLPSGVYPKVLFRKSLHELNDMDKMIDEAKRILIRHGSLIIIEANPRKPNQSDPGCKKKYLTSGQIQDIITARGFYLVEKEKEFIFKSQLSDGFYFNILKFQKP